MQFVAMGNCLEVTSVHCFPAESVFYNFRVGILISESHGEGPIERVQ